MLSEWSTMVWLACCGPGLHMCCGQIGIFPRTAAFCNFILKTPNTPFRVSVLRWLNQPESCALQ